MVLHRRNIDGLFIVLFFAATLHAQVQLKVLTFNVQHGYGTDNVHSASRQVQYMVAQKPDVVVMSEVSKADISGYLQYLKEQSGVTWNSVYFDDKPGKNEGNMIVTPMPITTSATHQYPTTFVTGIDMTMSAVEATIAGYCVFGTHLAWKGTVGGQARAIQVNDLLPWVTTFSCNKILMGDFNAGDLDPELQPLYQQYSEVWSQAVSTGVATSYLDNPPTLEARTRDTRHIDLIFTTPGTSVLAANMPDQRVLTKPALQLVATSDDFGVRPSDHNFVTAQVQAGPLGAGSNLTLSTNTLSFPVSGLGSTSTPQAVILSNPGNAVVRINAFASSADFAQSNTCGASLIPGGSCTINVTFTPRASGFRGGVLAVLDDAMNSPQIINLSGSGSLVGLTSISVSPSSTSVPLGFAEQFVALGTFSNGTIQDITRSVSWTSSSTNIAKLNGSIGLATPLLQGTTTVTAASAGLSGSAILTVTPPILQSISMSPSAPSILKGQTQQFMATGTYSDSSKANITSLVTWSSSKPLIASVNSTGLATGVATGSTTITAVSSTATSSTSLSVKAAALAALNITPLNSATALGTKQQFKATGTYTDGSTLDLTSAVAWNSTNTAVATVNNQGLATSVAVGSTSVTTTSGTVTGSATLSITPAVLVSLAITPAMARIPLGVTQQFTATGTFTDGSTQDVTKTVQWSSNATTVATISNLANTAGLASSTGTGSAQIVATSGTISGSTTISVTAAVLQSIAVTPANPSVALGTKQQFIATGTFSDGSTQDLSSTVTWASDTIATVSVNKTGLATGVGTGSATVSATLATVTGSTVLTVAAATLSSIIVSPSNAVTALSTVQQFTATGTYTDGTTQDLTTVGHWSSTAANVATISNSPGTAGVATALSQGITTIGMDMGSVSTSATLTVSSTALVSITINPQSATIALGTTQQFSAIGTYADGSTQDVTSVVTWSSSSPLIAIVSNAVGTCGLATSAGMGTASITATTGVVFASTNLMVGQSTLVSVAITPANSSIPAGATQQFTATGTYSDGTTQNLTNAGQWSSTAGGIATISNASGTQGIANAIAAGNTTIAINLGSVNASTTLTITPWALLSIAVSSQTSTIALGTTQQFTATGTYSDGSTLDLTNTAAWNSMNTAVTTVSNQGLATAVAVGTASVTATSGNVTGSTTLSITPAALVSLAITPAAASTSLGTTQQFTATGTFTDGSTQDVTKTVQWSSNATTVATISNLANTAGLASSTGTGSAQIVATSGTISGSTTLSVTAAVLPQTWVPNTGAGFHLNGPISAFATDVAGTTYAASNGTGVLVSADGVNWTYRGAPAEPSIESLMVSDRLWAGTHNGLYYSFNGGVTWIKYTYLPSVTVFSIGLYGTLLVLGTDTGIYSCTSSLCTKSTATTQEIRTILVTTTGVIAGATNAGNGGGAGGDLYRSADGSNWTKVGITNAWSFRSLTQDSSGNIYAGAYFKTYAAGGIYISKDGGVSWTGPVMPNADVNALSSANGLVYAGLGDGTLWSAPAGQNTWTKQVNPSGKSIRSLLYPLIGSDGIYRADLVPVNQPSTAPEVTQVLVAPDGTTYTRSSFFGITNNTKWIGPDGIEDQQSYRGNTMFFNSIGDLLAISGGNLYRWNGVSWLKATFSIPVAHQLRAHIVLPSGTILVSDTFPNVFQSLDGGTTFARISHPTAYLFFSFYYANGVLYGATEGGEFKSLDYGVTWSLLQSGSGGNYYSTINSPVSGTLLIGIADTRGLGAIFRYVNGLWSRSDRGIHLSESIFSFVQNGTNLYAVGNFALYVSTDDGNTWTATKGLPTFFFTYQAVIRPEELTVLPNGHMIVGIHWEGRGSFVQ